MAAMQLEVADAQAAGAALRLLAVTVGFGALVWLALLALAVARFAPFLWRLIAGT